MLGCYTILNAKVSMTAWIISASKGSLKTCTGFDGKNCSPCMTACDSQSCYVCLSLTSEEMTHMQNTAEDLSSWSFMRNKSLVTAKNTPKEQKMDSCSKQLPKFWKEWLFQTVQTGPPFLIAFLHFHRFN